MGELKRKVILIVSNDAGDAMRMSERLEQQGYRTEVTWSGVEALDWMATNRFDLLLVEEYVADIYVGEFLSRVSKLSDHPPIVVMQKNSRKDGSGDAKFRAYANVYKDDPEFCSAISVAINDGPERLGNAAEWGQLDTSVN